MEYQLSSRPLTAREPGRVYGSWMDDPRRVLERRLNEMKAGERFEFSGFVITRPGNKKVFHVCQAGKLAHHASGPAAKQSVIEFVIGKPDKGTEDMSEYTISKRAMELLQAANSQKGASSAGRGTMVALKSLQRLGLVELWKDGKFRATPKGSEYLHLHRLGIKDVAPAAKPEPADDPRVLVVNQPIRQPEPEPAAPSNGVPPAEDAPTLQAIFQCHCSRARALEYLMEQVPELRDAVDHYFALEKAVAKLRRS